jgi:UDP-galactopyranose mutase
VTTAKTIHIVGGGITGCTLAHFLKDKYSVHIHESSDALGGLLKSHHSVEGIPYQRAIFMLKQHTPWVSQLLSRMTTLVPIKFNEKINPLIDMCEYDFPFTKETILEMPFHWRETILLESEKTTGISGSNLEETIISHYGKTIFELFFDGFIRKLTGLDAAQFEESSWFEPYLKSIYSDTPTHRSIPRNGWQEVCRKLSSGVTVHLNSEVSDKDFSSGDVVVLTVRPDTFFGGSDDGIYRKSIFDIDSTKNNPSKPNTIYFPNHTPFISMTQLGSILSKDEKSIIVKRIVGDYGEVCTPIRTEDNKDIFKSYLKNGYYYCGPQAAFKTMTIAECMESAAQIASIIKREI